MAADRIVSIGRLLAGVCIIFWGGTGQVCAAITYFEQADYRSFSDSPFVGLGDLYFEDFEDGIFNTPYVSAPDGRVYTGPDVRSVDGDDGVIDGISTGGGSFVSERQLTPLHRFDFTPREDGSFPTFVGVVVTHEASLNFAVDSFSALSSTGGNLPGSRGFLIDDLAADFEEIGVVEHARFVGLYWSEDISSFFVSRALQLDHFQYSYAIPEPKVITLAGIVFSVLMLRRRR